MGTTTTCVRAKEETLKYDSLEKREEKTHKLCKYLVSGISLEAGREATGGEAKSKRERERKNKESGCAY